MKTVFRVVSLSILLFSAGRIIAQQPITLNSTDMPVVGWTQRTVKDTLPLPPINFGNKGANQVYNFGSLQGIVYDTVMYKALTSQQSSVFTGADLAITADDINFLFTKTTTAKTDLRGFEGKLVPNGNVIQVPFSTPSDLFHFPTTYNTRFSGTSALNKTVPGSDVGQPSVYEVRFTVNSTYQDTVDGWGKVITPVGSYKGLRKKRVETTTTHIEYRLCGTIICPWTTLSNTTTTTTRYTYPVLEAKGSVLTFDYDSANNVTGVTYSLIPPLAPVADFNYAAGAGGMVTFTDATDGYPDTYFWDFGDGSTSNAPNPTHTYTANGTYNVCLTVTNAGGSDTYCESVQVTGICPTILPNVTTNDAACGVADGSATVAPSGGANPYSFLWSNNQTTATINNLAAGSYTVTITDANSCTVVAAANVSNAGAPTVTETHIDVSCYGLCNGIINVSVSGGNPAYTYTWSDGQTSEDIQNACAGTYSFTVTDASNCAAVISVTITQPDSLVLSALITDASSSSAADGSIDLTVSGGTPPYDFLWNTGEDTEDIQGLSCSPYEVEVTDNNGCVKEVAFTVDCPVSVADFTDASSINIYPNPTTGKIFIEHDGNAVLKTEVYNALGENILNRELPASGRLNLSSHAKGIYFVRINNGQQVVLKKILIE